MPKLSLKSINEMLKASYMPVRVEQRNNKLVLRATLPPKPGSTKTKPHQQRIPLKCHASQQGLKRAKSEAFALGSRLEEGSFRWEDYLDSDQEKPEVLTVEKAIQQFEESYFQARGHTAKTLSTYRKDYQTPFNKLPREKKLTKELLIKTIKEKTEPATKNRHRTCIAYSRLSREVLEENLDLKSLKGDYKPKEVDPRILPTDEQIFSHAATFNYNPKHYASYCLIALYGLRPSEVFAIDPDSLKDDKGVIYITEGKTNDRLVYPSRLDWFEAWDIPNLPLPKTTAFTNSSKGNRISLMFREAEMPFVPYMLRHAYAVRLASYGVNPSIVAKWMGHSLTTHYKTYQKFISRQHFDREFDRTIKSREES